MESLATNNAVRTMVCKSFQEDRPNSALRGGQATLEVARLAEAIALSSSNDFPGRAFLISSQAGLSQSAMSFPHNRSVGDIIIVIISVMVGQRSIASNSRVVSVDSRRIEVLWDD
jgi:hypothetical protein